ncbi:hypothetical protein [Pontimicrobium sp. MEBiC01747]
MSYPYQIFGSENSLDLDVCFYVEALSSINNNHKTVEQLIEAEAFKTLKTVNANLAIVKEGIVVDCFKGIPDELNNALYKTYHLHEQKYERKIQRLVVRDLELRIARCARALVSYFTRTTLRQDAKEALKGTLRDKLLFLEQVELKDFKTFGKHGSVIEVYKSTAFQLGITLALFQDIELYTKDSIITLFPEFKRYLLRASDTSEALQKQLKLFVLLAKQSI